MTDEDIFREVEEDLRREQLKAYWDKFGVYIIGVAVIIIVAVAGYKGWGAWKQDRANSAGSDYSSAQELAQDGKKDEAASAFAKLVDEGPRGYRTLSRFQLASTHVQKGKIDDAVKLFDELGKSSDVDQVLKGFAKIQAALLRVEKADYDEMKSRLSGMAVTGNYWRHSARELLGLSAYKSKKYTEAIGYYDTITKDSDAPQELRKRATMMISLIDSAMVADKKAEPKSEKKEEK